MSKLKFSITGLFFLATFLISYAHDFEVDGIYYNKNADETSVTVTYRGNSYYEYYDEYSGNVVIPSSVTYSGNTYAVTSIGERAFYECNGLTSITIPNSVTSIGNSAFYFCSGLTSITIPNSVTSIGEGAFSYCYDLTSITIPNSVTSIGEHAFWSCSGLTTIVVESGNTVYDSRNNCNAIVESATNTLMFGCKNTIIPNSVTSIGVDAFSYCSGLTSITIPNSVTSIGERAFYECRGLTSVTIGNSVTSIGESAFSFCSGLNLLRCDAVTPPSLGSDVFYYVNQSTCNLVVPDQSINQYKAAEQWKDFLNTSDAEMVTVDESGISVENGAIVNKSNQQIDVYSISGAKAYSGNDAEITLPSGIYVVKAGEKVVKVAL